MAVVLIIVGLVAILFLAGGSLSAKVPSGTISTVAENAGFSGDDLITAVAIAYAESGGDPSATGDQSLAPDRGPSIGLWQINIGSKAHPEYANVDLTDPQTNANAAYTIYRRAGGFSPWSTYTGGQYSAFVDRATNEVNA